jgi:hypothetical protein
MKPNIRRILDHFIAIGTERGIRYAFKHTDTPTEDQISDSIHREVWAEIGEYFTLDEAGE